MNNRIAGLLAGHSVKFPVKDRHRIYKQLKKFWRFLNRKQKRQFYNEITIKGYSKPISRVRVIKNQELHIDWSHLTPRSKAVKYRKNSRYGQSRRAKGNNKVR